MPHAAVFIYHVGVVLLPTMEWFVTVAASTLHSLGGHRCWLDVLLPILCGLCHLQSKRLHSASLWLGVSGLALMVLLMGRRVKGSIMVGILFVTFISWIPNHAATYFGEASQLKGEHEQLLWESAWVYGSIRWGSCC